MVYHVILGPIIALVTHPPIISSNTTKTADKHHTVPHKAQAAAVPSTSPDLFRKGRMDRMMNLVTHK